MPRGRPDILIGFSLCALLCTLAVGQSQAPRDDIGKSLPPTNLSADSAVGRSGLPRPALGFANAHAASNPQVPDAKTVGEKTCIACHKLEADHFTHTLHSLGLHVANRSDPAIPGTPPCQGCHGADAGGPSISTGPYIAYPSLRGQYAPYLIARLTNFHKHLPHDTTNDFIMGSVAQTLDDESIEAIATWLSSLTPNRSL